MQNVAHSATGRSSLEDTGQMPALFGGSEQATEHGGAPDYEQIQASAEFTALRSRIRRFIFPMSLVFFLWYMAYVILAAYAHDFMSVKVIGEINIGIIFGVLQFVSTIAITAAYVRFANRKLDPQVEQIRAKAGVTNR